MTGKRTGSEVAVSNFRAFVRLADHHWTAAAFSGLGSVFSLAVSSLYMQHGKGEEDKSEVRGMGMGMVYGYGYG